MKAYALDLRQRVIDLVLRGLSYPQVSALLSISPSTVKRYVRQYRNGGDLCPRPRPGQPAVKGAALDAGLGPQLAQYPDATLAEHCQHWAATTGQQVSLATMRRAIARADWTRKKSRPAPASATRSSASSGC
jgi:transposase